MKQTIIYSIRIVKRKTFRLQYMMHFLNIFSQLVWVFSCFLIRYLNSKTSGLAWGLNNKLDGFHVINRLKKTLFPFLTTRNASKVFFAADRLLVSGDADFLQLFNSETVRQLVLTVGLCQLTGSLLNLVLYLINSEVVMDDLVDSIIKVFTINKKRIFYMKEWARGNCRLQF